jgi:hypothetical protein
MAGSILNERERRWYPRGRRLPLAHRIFLLSVLPACLVLLGAFAAVSKVVGDRVTEGVRDSLRREQVRAAQVRQAEEQRMREALAKSAENAALRESLLAGHREVLPDVLRQATRESDTDGVLLWNGAGQPLAGILQGKREAVLTDADLPPARAGLAAIQGKFYSVSLVDVKGAVAVGSKPGERLGALALARRVDLRSMHGLVALVRDGEILDSNAEPAKLAELRTQVRQCQPRQECQVQLAGEGYLSSPLDAGELGGAVALRSFLPVDAETRPLLSDVRRVFYLAAAALLLAALLMVALLSRSVVKPLVKLVDQLRTAERTGLLLPGFSEKSQTGEVNQLAQSFNRAASSVVESRKRLDRAYVTFVETLAQALDARDLYTAGHSRRVSEYSCAIANEMRLSYDQIAVIRVGALLHDLGKVGVPDQILQKPGPLTVEEFEILKQHPVIGKRILEPCDGFQQYLPIVELHHENHDGTGYPWQLADEAIPIEARIVHVADAYDAMTTDRPYRRGMPHEVAMSRLKATAGTQFDPNVVAAMDAMCSRGWRGADDWKATQQNPGVVALVRALRPEDARKPARLEDHQRA